MDTQQTHDEHLTLSGIVGVLDWKSYYDSFMYMHYNYCFFFQLQKDEGFYESNCIIFGLPDGLYGAPSQSVPEPSALEDISKSMVKVDQAIVRESYSTNSLSRYYAIIYTVANSTIIKIRY